MINCTFENGNIANPGLRHITVPVIVYRQNEILLGLRGTKNGKPILESGKWGLLGGFFDRDETLVEAAHREVMEESGWEIKTPQLFIINDSPNRPMEDRQNVDLIYIAEATLQSGTHDEEVKELRWFDLENLPPEDRIAFDHALAIKLYRKYKINPFMLPAYSYKNV